MKVLVAVEDKIFGKAIAEFVKDHQWPENTEIRLIHVLEPIYVGIMTGYPSELIANLKEERMRAAKSLLMSVGTEIRTALPRIALKEEVLEGPPKELIVDSACQWPAELIVLGSHGKSGLSRFFLGSVSMSVLSAAPCSVMIVKLNQQNESEKPGQIEKEVLKTH